MRGPQGEALSWPQALALTDAKSCKNVVDDWGSGAVAVEVHVCVCAHGDFLTVGD